jgi:extracellular elastinolytic metalloproteinase
MDNWLLTYVDASSQEIYGVVDYVSDIATFEVYPWPVIDPTKGSRSVLEDPWLIPTSEFTWLSDGTNYTTTRGNNGVAQSNPSGRTTNHLGNYRPNDPELTFNYPFSLSETNATAYWDASITQLFYTSNKYHDVLYLLGFTEAAGNFEHNNNGQGGSGSDSVILNTQDGSGMNNANFATPADGKQPRMRMYLFNSAPILRDSSFDAGVVIHEYTHGRTSLAQTKSLC